MNKCASTSWSSCVVARIYIVGSLVVLERGVRVRRNCNIFNLAMENVLKGLPDKNQLSRHHTQMHFKCTHFFNHFQIARSWRWYKPPFFFFFLVFVYGKGVQNTWTSSFKQVACLILMCNCLVQKINMIMMFCFYLIFNINWSIFLNFRWTDICLSINSNNTAPSIGTIAG
jgi:hypothetical protein